MLPRPVFDNDQVAALADMRERVDVVETCFVARAEGRLVAPPRHMENFAGPGLVFTIADRISRRRTATDVTLFCSVGLAGTEMAIASAPLRRAGRTA